MRNSQIKLYAGRVIYIAPHHGSKIIKATLVDEPDPFNEHLSGLEFIHYTTKDDGRVQSASLGDRGFGKNAYDSRPSAIHLTKFQAKKALKRGNKWWNSVQSGFDEFLGLGD